MENLPKNDTCSLNSKAKVQCLIWSIKRQDIDVLDEEYCEGSYHIGFCYGKNDNQL